ncbi:MAG TPA: protein-methionine-sulfoxide reductase heme-binding subunit MsrQ [Bacteroidota bacterium]|nr:protein-methionine-sulfoxide reductase heme-binding subunit MsrQ [Bacteroidota bacterium]
MKSFDWTRRVVKPAVFILCLVPLLTLVFDGLTGRLSPNPISDITDLTGIWTLRFLVITLSVTPIRRISGWSGAARLRRMLGLFAFFYVSLHFLTYIYLDKFFDLDDMIADVSKRPFITVGFASFLLLIPLAVTSNDRMTRWLGGKRWKRLHQLIYIIVVGGIIHYTWRLKAGYFRPGVYAAIVGILFLYRIIVALRPRLAKIQGDSRQNAPNAA